MNRCIKMWIHHENSASSNDHLLLILFPLFCSERILEEHEVLVEALSGWTESRDHKIHFLQRPQKNVLFREPQVSAEKLAKSLHPERFAPTLVFCDLQCFYMWRKSCLKAASEQEKQLLIEVGAIFVNVFGHLQ